MYGMVMEVHENTVIILSKDGDFWEVEVMSEAITVGELIPYENIKF